MALTSAERRLQDLQRERDEVGAFRDLWEEIGGLTEWVEECERQARALDARIAALEAAVKGGKP